MIRPHLSLPHMRGDMADAAGGRIEFLLEECCQLVVAHLEEVLGDDDRCRVHQNVDAPEPIEHLPGHCRDRGVVFEVGRNAENATGVLFAQFAHRVGVDAGGLADQDNDGAFGQQFLGAGFADTPAAAGDYGNFVFKSEIQVVLPAFVMSPPPSCTPLGLASIAVKPGALRFGVQYARMRARFCA